MKCPTCEGKGTITVRDAQGNDVAMACTYCGNTGEVPDPPIDWTCRACGGSGEITIQASDGTPRIVTCPGCSGKGRLD